MCVNCTKCQLLEKYILPFATFLDNLKEKEEENILILCCVATMRIDTSSLNYVVQFATCI